MRYEMRLARTARTVGYVEFEPQDGIGLSEAVEYLAQCPLDTYMHRFALAEMAQVEPSRARKMASGDKAKSNPALAALLAEAASQYPKFAKLAGKLGDPAGLAEHSPLVDLRLAAGDTAGHSEWMKLFKKNIERHKLMPVPDETGLAAPYGLSSTASPMGLKVADILGQVGRSAEPDHVDGPEEVAQRAVAAMQRVGLRAEPEMRHQASLSPVGLLREWLLETTVRNGRLDYELFGTQTAYGRGLDLASARASYLMEIVERRSAWAMVDGLECKGLASNGKLTRARLSELREQGLNALDPGRVVHDAPYLDQALHWIKGEEVVDGGTRPILVPAQLVFLFLNLDEQELSSGHGSTGLASGNDMAGARLSALMEIIERDAEAVTPYHPSRCFRLEADDAKVAGALADYRDKGIEVAFQDLTTEFGIPCYKAFATGPSGRVAKGAGAGLSGARAAISALTEVPYAYPQGPGSKPAPEGLPVRKLEDLPDLSTGSAGSDLKMVEKTLNGHGVDPIYVDLTLEGANIPVVRAIAPGLEHSADFDESSRVCERLYFNYLKLYALRDE